MFTLIENGEVYAPQHLGNPTVLLANDKILKIGDISKEEVKAIGVEVETIDARGCNVTPGFIDPHQHLWDMKKFKLAWQKGEETKPLQRSFVMSDYLEATKGLNVVKTVYMEVDVIPEQQVAEADYVIDLCERGDNPMICGVET